MRHWWLTAGFSLMAVPLAALSATLPVGGPDPAALAAAIQASQPGDTVSLAEGVYSLTESLKPKSGTTLVGAGQGRTILRFAGDKPADMVSLVGCQDVTLSDLTLDGASTGKVTTGVGAYNSRRLKLWRLSICNLTAGPQAPGPHAVHFGGDNPTHLHGVTDSVIADCEISNIGVTSVWGCGIRLSWGSSRNQVIGCRIAQTGRGGVFADNASNDLVIRDNTVSGSHGEMLGLEVWGGCDRCVIEDNLIDHWLSIGGCDWCAVRRNTVSATDGSFGFIGIEAIGSHLVITQNTVDDGQVIGLSLSGTDPKQYHYYADNTFRRCSQWGAQLQGESGGCACLYLLRCRFIETTVGRGKVWYPGDDGHGFRVNGNTRDMVLEECEISRNGRAGIQVTGADADGWSFRRCHLEDNKGVAWLGAPARGALEWVDCAVKGNAADTLPEASPFAGPSPGAEIEAPAEAQAGQPVSFAGRFQAAQGEVRQALWDFGDGPPAAGARVAHTYDRPGAFTVTVVVWDQAGRGTRAEKVVVVR